MKVVKVKESNPKAKIHLADVVTEVQGCVLANYAGRDSAKINEIVKDMLANGDTERKLASYTLYLVD